MEKFFFFLILSIITLSFECPQLQSIIKKDENELILYITKNINNLLSNSNKCIDILLQKGKLLSLDKYLSLLLEKKVKFIDSLDLSINSFKKKLEDLHNKYKFTEKDYQIISPAFQWAQSLDDIYIEIKFSHRHDSPGCIEINNINVTITNNTANFIGYCILGDIPIKIDFYIETWQDIDYENSTHGFYGLVGRYQMILRKKINGMYWDKLLSDKSNYLPNMGIWFEMKEKFQDQIKKFEEQIDNEDFKRQYEEIEREVKEKRERKEQRKLEREKKKIEKKKKKDNNTKEEKTTDL